MIPEEHYLEARALARSWNENGIRLAAPYLMPFEVSNALYRKVGAGEIVTANAMRLMRGLAQHDFELYPASFSYAAALQLATRLNQRAVYDSHYLALAQSLDCEFWTADERFYRSASPNLANIRLISEAAAPNQ